jgi:hypothetical protein
MEESEARRIFARTRIAAAERVLETGRAFCDDPTEERWAEFVQVLEDVSRLEASPLGRQSLDRPNSA